MQFHELFRSMACIYNSIPKHSQRTLGGKNTAKMIGAAPSYLDSRYPRSVKFVKHHVPFLQLYAVEANPKTLGMSLRVAQVVPRICSSVLQLPLQRRGYADLVSDKIKLTLALPHQVGARPSSTYHISYLWILNIWNTADNPLCR